MGETENNKRILQDFIQFVWREGDLGALPRFWTEDCVNHAMPGRDNRGLGPLRAYHAGFSAAFSAFSHLQIEIVQQVAEADRVVSQIMSCGQQTGPFLGVEPAGKTVTLSAIRIDRFVEGKIAEHWSVSDLAGMMQQLQSENS